MYVCAVGVVSNVIELLNISTLLEVTVIVHPEQCTERSYPQQCTARDKQNSQIFYVHATRKVSP